MEPNSTSPREDSLASRGKAGGTDTPGGDHMKASGRYAVPPGKEQRVQMVPPPKSRTSNGTAAAIVAAVVFAGGFITYKIMISKYREVSEARETASKFKR